jgi:hypothetical protein
MRGLYDMGNKKHSDSVWKENAWGQIGEELNKSGKFLMFLFQILNLQPFNYYQSSKKINASLRNYHVLFRKVTERDGECEHRAFWRNGDGTLTERKRDAYCESALIRPIPEPPAHIDGKATGTGFSYFSSYFHFWRRSRYE